ncbi:RIP homotypic interaction motif-containing protein [Kushneria indalinina]|uniref:RIP homotypic interaction motif-containing protein n=1 Tax=Kushneria indalinina TaxID=184067 RepID=UPI00147373F7|nr:RIP homotypic interaction motif-containing protein [Kushneria indalinina]
MSLLKEYEDEARVEKKDGSVIGPYKAAFPGKTIFILDEKADVEEGDIILRKLPSDKDERCIVTEVTFYKRGVTGMGAHYQVKYRKGGQSEIQKPAHTINIHGAQSVQVGDYNTQNIVNSFEALVKKIESADLSSEQKEEAKGMLRKLLEHPAVVSVIGAATGAVF